MTVSGVRFHPRSTHLYVKYNSENVHLFFHRVCFIIHYVRKRHRLETEHEQLAGVVGGENTWVHWGLDNPKFSSRGTGVSSFWCSSPPNNPRYVSRVDPTDLVLVFHHTDTHI
jgi:hypothetical protein